MSSPPPQARAGGLGLIGCGYGHPSAGYGSLQWIDDQFDAAGNEKVGAGFISWSLAERPQLLDRVLDRGTDPLFLSFGDPAPFIGHEAHSSREGICEIAT